MELDDEFAGFIADAYALAPTGRRLYDSAFISRAKGRAKSELAAFVVLFEAFGLCRFERWAEGGETYSWRGETYVFEPGEPIGRRVEHPFIRCLATEEGQAGNTYDNVYYNLTEGPLAEGLPRYAAGLTRTALPDGGEIVPSTASSAAKDGGKETFSVFDETHLYVLPELRRMYDVVRRNLRKRKAAQPWSLETSTMYGAGEDSVAEDTHKLAKAIREGKTRSTRTLFDHRQAPPDVDLTDAGALREALREVYGPFAEVMDLDGLIDHIWDPRNAVADSRRYILNQPSSAADAWLQGHQVDGAADPTRVVADRERIVLGFDGSRGRVDGVADSTVLVGVRLSDGHIFLIDAWEEPDGPDGAKWEVPVRAVDAAVKAAFARYDVVGFFADPSGWSEKIATWTATYGPRLKVKVTGDHPIRWKTNQHTRWVESLKALHDALVLGSATFDGSTVLAAHFKNARRRPTRSGLTIAKEHPGSRKKIDGSVAATYGWAAYLAAVAAGLNVQKRRGTVERLN